MGDPVTTAILIGVASGGMQMGASIYGANEQNKAAKQQSANDAQTAKYNADLSRKQATADDNETLRADQMLRQQQEQQIAQQRAMFGLSGAAIDTGAPLAIIADTAGKQTQESQQLRMQGYRQAQHNRDQAKNYDRQYLNFRRGARDNSILKSGIATGIASGISTGLSAGLAVGTANGAFAAPLPK